MNGRVAVVSGGTGALGQCVSRRLLSAGAAVCIPYVIAAELDALKAGLDASALARVRAVHADVTDEAGFDGFVRGVLDAHGRIDILVNGVGGFAPGDLASTSLSEWNRMLTLNLTSAAIGCRGVLPAMIAAGFGRIVNIASRAVVPPLGGFIGYTVAKAGVITLTQALAREVPRGITVNAVLPSTMDTPANRQAMPDADRSQWVSPDAVAEVIAYLASDQAAMVSGATIPV
jgi:NAD(P)-dependent dehydrogenase (short-subunit alcohol dehydrogenase family)